MLEFAGASGPLLTWPGSQISERTNGILARSLRRSHRLDQLVVGVGLTLMSARCPAEEHCNYRQRFALTVKKRLILYSPLQWLILLFSLALCLQPTRKTISARGSWASCLDLGAHRELHQHHYRCQELVGWASMSVQHRTSRVIVKPCACCAHGLVDGGINPRHTHRAARSN